MTGPALGVKTKASAIGPGGGAGVAAQPALSPLSMPIQQMILNFFMSLTLNRAMARQPLGRLCGSRETTDVGRAPCHLVGVGRFAV